jgi:hypothetical protein
MAEPCVLTIALNLIQAGKQMLKIGISGRDSPEGFRNDGPPICCIAV